MRCDLANLLRNAADRVALCDDDDLQGPYYAEGLRQVAEHIELVRGGKATLAEFADCYKLLPAPGVPE